MKQKTLFLFAWITTCLGEQESHSIDFKRALDEDSHAEPIALMQRVSLEVFPEGQTSTFDRDVSILDRFTKEFDKMTKTLTESLHGDLPPEDFMEDGTDPEELSEKPKRKRKKKGGVGPWSTWTAWPTWRNWYSRSTRATRASRKNWEEG